MLLLLEMADVSANSIKLGHMVSVQYNKFISLPYVKHLRRTE